MPGNRVKEEGANIVLDMSSWNAMGATEALSTKMVSEVRLCSLHVPVTAKNGSMYAPVHYLMVKVNGLPNAFPLSDSNSLINWLSDNQFSSDDCKLLIRTPYDTIDARFAGSIYDVLQQVKNDYDECYKGAEGLEFEIPALVPDNMEFAYIMQECMKWVNENITEEDMWGIAIENRFGINGNDIIDPSIGGEV